MKTHHLILTVAALVFAASPGLRADNLLYTEGHADIGVAYEEDEGFVLHYHLHAGAVLDGAPIGEDEEYAPDEILAALPDGTKNTIGANAMIGTTVGNPDVWVLPQVQQTGVPFLGFGTEELGPEWSNITFTLDAVASPSGSGNFSLWSTGTFGNPTFYFSTANPSGTANGANTLVVPPGTHGHYNLGFTEAGRWEITLTAMATHPEYGFVSDTKTYSFAVAAVPEPTTYGLAMGALLLGACAARRRRKAR